MGIVSNLLFGDGGEKTSYKDAAIKKRYSDISNSTFDAMYGGMKDHLDKNYDGGYAKFQHDRLSGLKDDADKALTGYKKDRYNVFGNGMIGGILNPIVQTAGTLGDLTILAGTGGKENAWADDEIGYKRDIGSDLGAAGETAMTLIPAMRGMKLAKAEKAVKAAKAAGTVIEPGTKLAKQAAMVDKSQLPKTTMQKATMGALLGAGYSGANSLKEMGFENFDPGQLALSAGIGGVTGGALAGIGDMASKAWNKYSTSIDKDAISKAMSEYAKKDAPYQEALSKLRSEGITGEGDALHKAYRTWTKANHPDVVGRSNAIALLPEKAGQANIDPAQLFSEKKVSQRFLDGLSGQARNNNPYIQAQGFRPQAADYMKEINEQINKNATNKFKTIQDAMKIVEGGRPADLDLSSIARKKAGSLGEAIANIKNNLITTNPNSKMVRYGSKVGNKVSNLLKTKKGKVLAGGGAGLLLAKLLGGNGGEIDTDNMSDEELYNYIVNGGI